MLKHMGTHSDAHSQTLCVCVCVVCVPMLKCMHTQTCVHVHTHGCTHMLLMNASLSYYYTQHWELTFNFVATDPC